MPFGFRLGRKKSSSPTDNAYSHVDTSSTSSFRVIPRGGSPQKMGRPAKDKPLPLLNQHGRSWSEEDRSSSSNRASDSTSSTNKSRVYASNLYDHPVSQHGQGKLPNGAHHLASPASPGDSDKISYLDMPGTHSPQDGYDQGFDDKDDGQNASTAADVHRYDSSAYGPQHSLHNSRSADWNTSPRSLRSPASDEESLSPSHAAAQQDRGPPPPVHGSPPVKIQTFDVLRNAVSPSLSDDYKSDAWIAPVIKRMDSTESFTRSGSGIDADAKMVRRSVMIRRDTTDSQELEPISPTRPVITKRFSSLHPPPHQSQFNSSNSSKTPSISSTASSQGQTLSDVSVTPKIASPSTPQRASPSNASTPRAANAKNVTVDSDSEDEPLATTLKRISSNPRLSVIAAQPTGSRLSVVPADNKRLSKFDNMRPVSTVSASPAVSPSKSRPLSEQVQNLGSRPPSALALVEEDSPSNRASTASQKLEPSNSPSHSRTPSDNENKSSDDDDDVPLALLPAANPPIRTRASDSRLSQYTLPGQARLGAGYGTPSVAGGRNSLPPFARRLPHDPYGSPEGVLNASRESLLLSRAPSLYPPGQSPVPGLPPGGLVGVIAEEERNKSWRRAAGAGQVGPAGLNAGMSMGMQGPMSIPGLGHGLLGAQQMAPGMMGAEQTQFNQQLVQLVHQQSMMLQQMQAMMQQQQQQQQSYAGSVLGFPEPEYAQQAPSSPSLRPRSMLSSGLRTQSMINLNRPPNAPRTMSMINPIGGYSTNWHPGQEPLISSATSVRGMADGYASSVAPSERSTIGQPNRYRPVTNQATADMQPNQAGYNRSSMANPPVYGPLAGGDDEEDPIAKKKRSGFFSAMVHPRGRNSTIQVEEEDEDWGKFAQKRRSTLSAVLG